MCGIVGFSGKKYTETSTTRGQFKLENIKLLLFQNSVERLSNDGAGIYSKSTGILKSAISISSFLSSKEINTEIKPSNVLIGHVRNKSGLSSVNKDNSHPYRINNIVGAHNGNISNIEDICTKYNTTYDKTKTDSLNFFNCIAEINKIQPIVDVEGPCTILFTDLNTPDKLYLFRKDREIYYGSRKEGTYISSSRSALETINCEDVLPFKELSFYCIEDGVVTELFKLDPVEYKINNSLNIPVLDDVWVQANKDYSIHGIIKNEWYLARYASPVSANYSCNFKDRYVTIKEGTFHSINSPKKYNLYLSTPISVFDINERLDYSKISYKTPKLMVLTRDVSLTDSTVLGEGSYFIASYYMTTKRTMDGTDVNNDRKVTDIPQEALRIATIDEMNLFNTTIKSGDFSILDKIPYRFLPVIFNTKLSSPNNVIKTIKNDLEDLRKMLEEQKDTKYLTKITELVDKIEIHEQ